MNDTTDLPYTITEYPRGISIDIKRRITWRSVLTTVAVGLLLGGSILLDLWTSFEGTEVERPWYEMLARLLVVVVGVSAIIVPIWVGLSKRSIFFDNLAMTVKTSAWGFGTGKTFAIDQVTAIGAVTRLKRSWYRVEKPGRRRRLFEMKRTRSEEEKPHFAIISEGKVHVFFLSLSSEETEQVAGELRRRCGIDSGDTKETKTA